MNKNLRTQFEFEFIDTIQKIYPRKKFMNFIYKLLEPVSTYRR